MLVRVLLVGIVFVPVLVRILVRLVDGVLDFHAVHRPLYSVVLLVHVAELAVNVEGGRDASVPVQQISAVVPFVAGRLNDGSIPRAVNDLGNQKRFTDRLETDRIDFDARPRLGQISADRAPAAQLRQQLRIFGVVVGGRYDLIRCNGRHTIHRINSTRVFFEAIKRESEFKGHHSYAAFRGENF